MSEGKATTSVSTEDYAMPTAKILRRDEEFGPLLKEFEANLPKEKQGAALNNFMNQYLSQQHVDDLQNLEGDALKTMQDNMGETFLAVQEAESFAPFLNILEKLGPEMAPLADFFKSVLKDFLGVDLDILKKNGANQEAPNREIAHVEVKEPTSQEALPDDLTTIKSSVDFDLENSADLKAMGLEEGGQCSIMAYEDGGFLGAGELGADSIKDHLGPRISTGVVTGAEGNIQAYELSGENGNSLYIPALGEEEIFTLPIQARSDISNSLIEPTAPEAENAVKNAPAIQENLDQGTDDLLQTTPNGP